MATEKRINIAIRIRPSLENERYDAHQTQKIDDSSIAVALDDVNGNSVRHCFAFDAVFDELDTQQTVYEETVRGIVDHSLSGCNSTIFAYGQTGSGKTYTILGETQGGKTKNVGKESGIFLRLFEDLFWYRDAIASKRHVVVALSAIELYIDEVRDLFNSKAPVKIRDTGDDTHLPDVRCAVINSMDDAFHYFTLASSHRTTRATQINDTSSRSHALFFIDLFVVPAEPESSGPPPISHLFAEDAASKIPGFMRSRISLVDLAGSERVKKSGVEGIQLIEANSIHKSLTSLHMVIHAMWARSPHIPFRDSKLTRILRSSFTDRTSSVLLIGQVTPGQSTATESLGTLRFCDNVKTLKFAGSSPLIDPREEELFGATLRRCDEICADIQILTVLHYFTLQRPRHYAKVRNVPVGGAIAVVTEQYRRRSAKEASEREQKELEDLQKQAMLEGHKARMEWQQRYAERSTRLQLMEQETETRHMLDANDAQQKEEIEKRLHEAKISKRNRLDLEARRDKLLEKAEKARRKIQRLTSEIQTKMYESRTPQTVAEDELWEEFEENWIVAEANHAIVEVFFKDWTELTCVQSEYVTTMSHVDALFDEVGDISSQYVWLEVGDLVSDVIEFVIDRTVDIAEHRIDEFDSYTWFDIHEVSQQRRLKDSSVWTRALFVTPDPNLAPLRSYDTPRGTVLSDDESREPEQRGSINEGEQPQKMKKTLSSRVTSSVTKNFDVAEADKVYLMTVYDSPNLVTDVLKFMSSPTIMTKHGRHGRPHYRKFWISPAFQGGGRDLVWSDPEEGPKAQISGVSVGEICGIQLGPFGKVFERSTIVAGSKEFFLSFSVILRDGSRTVDITADNLVNFEAWVLGLSHMARTEPRWGKPLDLTRDQTAWQLTRKERSVCEENCIPPVILLRVKEKVIALREEVAMHMRLFANNPVQAYDALGGIHAPQMNPSGAILMTKGELRHHGSPYDLDIFRICRMWILLEEENLIFDPGFCLPTQCASALKARKRIEENR